VEKEERERIIIPDENGDEHLFEVLFTFDVDETEKSYMVLVAAGEEESDDEDVLKGKKQPFYMGNGFTRRSLQACSKR